MNKVRRIPVNVFASCMTRLWFTYLINGRSGGVVLEVCTALRTLILSFQSTYLGHSLFGLALATFKTNVKISRTTKREQTSGSKLRKNDKARGKDTVPKIF